MKSHTQERTKARNSQTFRLTAPEARRVVLVGEFTRWQEEPIPMRQDAHGTWTATVILEPGRYAYRFIVDGEWRDDPECRMRVPNPFGTEDMIREAA